MARLLTYALDGPGKKMLGIAEGELLLVVNHTVENRLVRR
jgi:hypothetical protein